MTPLTPELLKAALPLLHHCEALTAFFHTDRGDLMQCWLRGESREFPGMARLSSWYHPEAYNIEIEHVWIYDKLAARLTEIVAFQASSKAERVRHAESLLQAAAVFVEMAAQAKRRAAKRRAA